MIIETAIGDAYAVAWEFLKPGEGPEHDWNGYKRRPKTGDREPSPPARFTDDTLRTIANARVIIAGETSDPLAYVREIKAVFRADGRMGWSKNFHAFLEAQAELPDEEWFAARVPRNTNGALMGAAVMGLLPQADLVANAAVTQALVTHDGEAAGYAAAVALASFGIRRGIRSRSEILEIALSVSGLVSADRLRQEMARTDRVDMSAARTAGAVLRVLTEAQTLRQVIDMTLAMGGDTDSVAAAALGIAAQSDLWENDLPDWAYDDLEGEDNEAVLEDLAQLERRAKNACMRHFPAGPVL